MAEYKGDDYVTGMLSEQIRELNQENGVLTKSLERAHRIINYRSSHAQKLDEWVKYCKNKGLKIRREWIKGDVPTKVRLPKPVGLNFIHPEPVTTIIAKTIDGNTKTNYTVGHTHQGQILKKSEMDKTIEPNWVVPKQNILVRAFNLMTQRWKQQGVEPNIALWTYWVCLNVFVALFFTKTPTSFAKFYFGTVLFVWVLTFISHKKYFRYYIALRDPFGKGATYLWAIIFAAAGNAILWPLGLIVGVYEYFKAFRDIKKEDRDNAGSF